MLASQIAAHESRKLGLSSSERFIPRGPVEDNNNEVDPGTGANNGTNADICNKEASQVIKFYRNKNVLITGASGFLGKVLLWKLIETCPEIGKIYVLIRAKHDMSAEKRLIQMLKGKPFCFKYQYTDLLQKVVAIESDMTSEGLGLSQTDRTLLEDRVNIVIHSAASVKFDAPLKDNLRDNVYGTRSIVNLCNNVKNLEALVHVSTAYSNCQAKDIGEELQPLKMDIDDVVKIVESLPDDACDSVTDKLLEGRPNTYTYTKAVAEHFVARQEGKFPISIVRPSIVISSYKEPVPGWVDNVNGIAGLGCLAAIAYQVRTHSPKKMLIYNMTSGNMKPISWGSFFDMLRSNAVQTPPNKIVRPMIHAPRYKRASPVNFLLIRFLSELLFAYTIDTILTLIGYKKIMVKITQKMHHGYKILKPFTTNQWNFRSDNVIHLSESLPPVDRDLFKVDMRGFDWEAHAKSLWKGARLFLLKEEETENSYNSGRLKQSIVTVVHYSFILIFMAIFAAGTYSGARLFNLV